MTKNEFWDKWDLCYANRNARDIKELFEAFETSPLDLRSDKKIILSAVYFLHEYSDEEKFLETIPKELWEDEEFCTEIIITEYEHGCVTDLTINYCKNPDGTAEGILYMQDIDSTIKIYSICDEVASNPSFYKHMLRLTTEDGLGFDPYVLCDFMEALKKFTRPQIAKIIGMSEEELF